MAEEITVLVVPPGEGREWMGDPRIDKVETDPEAENAFIETRVVSEDGSTTVDRSLVTDTRKKVISDSIATYQEESAKDAPDVQIQLKALERAISFMWDVVSGEDVGSAQPVEQTDTTTDSTTDDSTSA
ncbi:hypothetical protein HSTV-3_gp34 [Halorubrum virus HSTV-3]|nr:hypothetical protein HSTV-3_gp34 [Halorubrum virus HSTV-3]